MIIFVVVAILAAYVASNNPAAMDINLLGYPLRASSGVLLAGSLGIGFLLGALLMLPAVISKSWAVIRHRRKIQDLQDEQTRMKKASTMKEVEEE
jgi:hypothetical protein